MCLWNLAWKISKLFLFSTPYIYFTFFWKKAIFNWFKTLQLNLKDIEKTMKKISFEMYYQAWTFEIKSYYSISIMVFSKTMDLKLYKERPLVKPFKVLSLRKVSDDSLHQWKTSLGLLIFTAVNSNPLLYLKRKFLLMPIFKLHT